MKRASQLGLANCSVWAVRLREGRWVDRSFLALHHAPLAKNVAKEAANGAATSSLSPTLSAKPLRVQSFLPIVSVFGIGIAYGS